MKQLIRLFCLLLCPALMVPGLCSCSNAQTQSETTTETNVTLEETTAPPKTGPLCDGKTLKLLAITSSFGLNTTEHLYAVAKAEGCENIIVGRLYYSGCTLKMHDEYAKNNSAVYQYTKFKDDERTVMENVTMEYGIREEDWDIIFIQQGAEQAGRIETYGDYLDSVMAYVNTKKRNADVPYVWNMTWAFQHDNTRNVFINTYKNDQMTMYNMILDCTKQKIVGRTDIAAIIPSGTAIQNARTSYFGDTLTKDTLHLNNLGRVIAAYTVWAILTDKPLTDINLGPVNSYDLTTMLELSDSDRQVILEAVNNAIKTPFAVTPSSYPTK